MREINTQEYNQYKERLMNLTWFMYSEKEFDGEDEEAYKDSIREELEGSKKEMKSDHKQPTTTNFDRKSLIIILSFLGITTIPFLIKSIL